MNFYFIYYIFNTRTQKGYIGYTNDLNRRLYDHIKALREGVHSNKELQKDFNEEDIEIKILETYHNKDNNFICSREKFLIEKYDTYNNGYNQSLGGEGQADLRKFSFDNVFKAYAIMNFYPEISIRVLSEKLEMSESSLGRLKKRETYISTITIFDKLSLESKEKLKKELDLEFNLSQLEKESYLNKYQARGLDRETVLMIIAATNNINKIGGHIERHLNFSGVSRIKRGLRYKEIYQEYQDMNDEEKNFWLDKSIEFFNIDKK